MKKEIKIELNGSPAEIVAQSWVIANIICDEAIVEQLVTDNVLRAAAEDIRRPDVMCPLMIQMMRMLADISPNFKPYIDMYVKDGQEQLKLFKDYY